MNSPKSGLAHGRYRVPRSSLTITPAQEVTTGSQLPHDSLCARRNDTTALPDSSPWPLLWPLRGCAGAISDVTEILPTASVHELMNAAVSFGVHAIWLAVIAPYSANMMFIATQRLRNMASS